MKLGSVAGVNHAAGLKERLRERKFIRIMEAHSGLSAIVAERARAERGGTPVGFDGLWVSSLTDSAVRGLPDVEIVGNAERLETVRQIRSVSQSPILVDGDTGGTGEQFEYFVRGLIRAGAGGVVIEDKVFPKRNSLDLGSSQHLEKPYVFAQKIARGVKAAEDTGFLVFARLESFISGSTLEDALMRAQQYAEAGADGILVHSKERTPHQVIAFAERFGELCEGLGRRPVLACVPTTYNTALDTELAEHGYNLIIHANHLLRSALLAMTKVAQSILDHDRSFEATAHCAPVMELFEAVGYEELTKRDRELAAVEPPLIVNAEALDSTGATSGPRALVPVGDRPILRHQIESARRAGVSKVGVILGHGAEAVKLAFNDHGVIFFEGAHRDSDQSVASLFAAESLMDRGFVLLQSDVFVAPEVLRQLLDSPGSIVLVVDRIDDARRNRGQRFNEVVLASHAHGARRLRPTESVDVLRLSQTEMPSGGAYEFSGLALVRRDGAQILKKLYHDLRQRDVRPFRQATSVHEASFTDLLQEYLERGFEVRALEVGHGWMSLRTREDLRVAESELAGPKVMKGTGT